MNQEQTLEAICKMAVDFNDQGNVSMLELFNKSGYKTQETEISEELIEEFLLKKPDLLESWLMESENTRATPAWYVSPKDNNWIVGLYPGGKEKKFSDKTKAVACYIKKYMEALSEL